MENDSNKAVLNPYSRLLLRTLDWIQGLGCGRRRDVFRDPARSLLCWMDVMRERGTDARGVDEGF